MAEERPPVTGPVLAPRGGSPAAASPAPGPESSRWHVYETHPVPWWLALLWLGFFAFAIAYLIVNLLE
jgi:hypothetical protein